MIKPARQSEYGFSLAETMVALTVLSINLIGAVSMFALAQDGISAGKKSLEAMALAESRMERMRAAAYHTLLIDDLEGDGLADVVLEDSGNGADATAGDGEYTARLTVNQIVLTWTVHPDHPLLARSRTATITVTAEWSDRQGRRRTIRLGMQRANPLYTGGAS
jgi:type II secretory pathway component PulJ